MSLGFMLGQFTLAHYTALSKCRHEDWGYDESGEAYCHDCRRVIPINLVPRRGLR